MYFEQLRRILDGDRDRAASSRDPYPVQGHRLTELISDPSSQYCRQSGRTVGDESDFDSVLRAHMSNDHSWSATYGTVNTEG